MKKLITIILLVVTSLFMFSCGEEETNDLSNKNTNNKKVVIDGINYLKIGEFNSEGQIDYYFSLEEFNNNFSELNPGYDVAYLDLIPNPILENKYSIIISAYEQETQSYVGLAFDTVATLIEIEGKLIFCVSDANPSSTSYKCKLLEGCEGTSCEFKHDPNGYLKCACSRANTVGQCQKVEDKKKRINFLDMESVMNMNPDFDF